MAEFLKEICSRCTFSNEIIQIFRAAQLDGEVASRLSRYSEWERVFLLGARHSTPPLDQSQVTGPLLEFANAFGFEFQDDPESEIEICFDRGFRDPVFHCRDGKKLLEILHTLRLTENCVQRFRRFQVWKTTVERGGRILKIADERVLVNILLFLTAFFRKTEKKSSEDSLFGGESHVVPVTVDSDGQIQFDAVEVEPSGSKEFSTGQTPREIIRNNRKRGRQSTNNSKSGRSTKKPTECKWTEEDTNRVVQAYSDTSFVDSAFGVIPGHTKELRNLVKSTWSKCFKTAHLAAAPVNPYSAIKGRANFEPYLKKASERFYQLLEEYAVFPKPPLDVVRHCLMNRIRCMQSRTKLESLYEFDPKSDTCVSAVKYNRSIFRLKSRWAVFSPPNTLGPNKELCIHSDREPEFIATVEIVALARNRTQAVVCWILKTGDPKLTYFVKDERFGYIYDVINMRRNEAFLVDLGELRELTELEEFEMRHMYRDGVKPLKQLFTGLEDLPVLQDDDVPEVDIQFGIESPNDDQQIQDHSYQIAESVTPAPLRKRIKMSEKCVEKVRELDMKRRAEEESVGEETEEGLGEELRDKDNGDVLVEDIEIQEKTHSVNALPKEESTTPVWSRPTRKSKLAAAESWRSVYGISAE